MDWLIYTIDTIVKYGKKILKVVIFVTKFIEHLHHISWCLQLQLNAKMVALVYNARVDIGRMSQLSTGEFVMPSPNSPLSHQSALPIVTLKKWRFQLSFTFVKSILQSISFEKYFFMQRFDYQGKALIYWSRWTKLDESILVNSVKIKKKYWSLWFQSVIHKNSTSLLKMNLCLNKNRNNIYSVISVVLFKINEELLCLPVYLFLQKSNWWKN